MKSKPDNNKADQKYIYGEDSAATLAHHGSRTAEKQAGWFLPFLQPDMTLLDCGCGSGSITFGLAKAVEPGQVIGVDVLEKEIMRAQEKASEAKIPNIRFDVGDICHLDFADNSFDGLFSHNVLEHIPEPNKALQEMRRVLKPGGVIGIRDVDYGGLVLAPDTGFWERLLVIWEADFRTGGGDPRIGRHLGRLFFEAGFIDVEATASYDVFSDLESRRFTVEALATRLDETDFTERVTGSGLAKVEELMAIKEKWLAWIEIPGAIFALSHFEATGRKAR